MILPWIDDLNYSMYFVCTCSGGSSLLKSIPSGMRVQEVLKKCHWIVTPTRLDGADQAQIPEGAAASCMVLRDRSGGHFSMKGLHSPERPEVWPA